LFCSYVGLSQRRVTSFRRDVDYIFAGIASLGIFAYLVYALLRPERF